MAVLHNQAFTHYLQYEQDIDIFPDEVLITIMRSSAVYLTECYSQAELQRVPLSLVLNESPEPSVMAFANKLYGELSKHVYPSWTRETKNPGHNPVILYSAPTLIQLIQDHFLEEEREGEESIVPKDHQILILHHILWTCLDRLHAPLIPAHHYFDLIRIMKSYPSELHLRGTKNIARFSELFRVFKRMDAQRAASLCDIFHLWNQMTEVGKNMTFRSSIGSITKLSKL